ncbi:MAG: NAD(P)/FAD-dependent oxidoreductase [Candidatus Saganbacteria bacterium]|nr:NAD(P)/FAD-dependent oxidoreductase [Candidatus Saganbacteria bacterium]
MDKVDITIIGGGIVGLAIAKELSEKYPNKDIVVLEKHESYGEETSSRNSEVVHSGIYYTPGSLKAKFCVLGKKMLWDICEKNNILFRKLGKLIVATNQEEIKQLDELFDRGRKNGVEDLEIIGVKGIRDLEPNIKALAALYSPGTGVIDSHSIMKYFYQKAKDSGVMFCFGSEVTGIRKEDWGYRIDCRDRSLTCPCIKSRVVINAAGLWADKIAAMVGIDIEKSGYKLYYLKGEYFSYSSTCPLVNGLVYPTPQKGNKSLGIHTLVDPGGSIKFGPNAYPVDEIDYNVVAEHRSAFHQSIITYLPDVKLEDLSPDQSGIRPKLAIFDGVEPDFIIIEEKEKGFPGFINLIGIESPGLTSVPAISKFVSDLF